jgi:hypothetical protein
VSEHPDSVKEKEIASERPERPGYNDRSGRREHANVNKDPQLTRSAFKQTFIQRLDEAFQDMVVNVEFETFENSIKKVTGATLTRIGTDHNTSLTYVELVSPIPLIPFQVLTFMPGVATPVSIQFVTAIIIRNITRVISVERLF